MFWLSELVICQWDQERWGGNVVEKGFIPCLIIYAVVDFLMIPPLEASLGSLIYRARPQQRHDHSNQLAWISIQTMQQSKPQTVYLTELVIAHQASTQIRVGGTRSIFSVLQKLR